MRKGHMEAVERQAAYAKEYPSEWKKAQTAFINALFQHHREVIERVRKQPGGKKKIIELYDIKNLKGYPSLQD